MMEKVMLQWFPNAHFYVNLLWKSRDPRIICRFSLRNKIRGWISSLLSFWIPSWKIEKTAWPEKWFHEKRSSAFSTFRIAFSLENKTWERERKEPGLRQSRFFANDAAYFSTLMQYVSEYTPTSIREVVAASKMSLFSLFFLVPTPITNMLLCSA